MASDHLNLTRALHRAGALTALALGAAIAGILWLLAARAAAGDASAIRAIILPAALIALVVFAVAELVVVGWLRRQVVEPLATAERVAKIEPMSL